MQNVWLEKNYINRLTYKLPNLVKKNDNLYNFRCPFCGDSQKNKLKSRGYLYLNNKAGSFWFKCFNCGQNKSFKYFIKEIDNNLYDDFILDLFKYSNENKFEQNLKKNEIETNNNTNVKSFNFILDSLTPISDFSPENPIRKYISNRKISEEYFSNIFYVKRFMEWINTIINNKFSASQLRIDEPRLVIPFFDKDGNLFAVAGRSFKKNSIKYITIKFTDDTKIFGMERVDTSKRVYIVEGPIDSFFIDNSIAFAGSSGNIPHLDDCVIILDNEPRNREIVKLMEKFISKGYNICIWPKEIKYKDINDMFAIGGYSKETIKNIIDKNTFHGLDAQVRLAEWKVVRT